MHKIKKKAFKILRNAGNLLYVSRPLEVGELFSELFFHTMQIESNDTPSYTLNSIVPL